MAAITLLSTYSALAKPDVLAALSIKPPPNRHLSQHQVDTYTALMQAGPGDVVFNTAFTGDGKSLAGLLPMLCASGNIPKSLCMFPTKELGRDQLRQIECELRNWLPHAERLVKVLDADELDLQSAKRDLSRGDTLRSILSDGDFVLTNPDILHYIMQACYVRKDAESPDRIIGTLVNAFNQLTFDEFHIFDASQVVAVTNALLFIRRLAGRSCPRFLFLSATPDQMMLKYFERAGIPHREIKGQYCHGQPVDPVNWRLILRESKLTVQSMTVPQWLDAHQDDVLLRFFKVNGRHAKGAVIVNSVATAQGLYTRLEPVLKQHGLRVALNTGFDTRAARRQSYDADLLIGTSTVDIGVDFQINFLLFESFDAGTFLQRLGRLGRHDGYQRDGEKIPFHAFEAHALTPAWVNQAIFEGRDEAPRMLADGQVVDRELLRDCVKAAFYSSSPFSGYGKCWGGLQAANILSTLHSPLVRDAYTEMRAKLAADYAHVLGVRMTRELSRLRLMQKEQRPLFDEALSFRGSSLFDAGVIDERLPQSEPRTKRYDLLWLLANMHVEVIDKEAFLAQAHRDGWDHAATERLKLIGTLKCTRQRDSTQPVEFLVGHDLQCWEHDWFHKAQVLDRIEIVVQGVPGLNAINRRLAAMSLPVLLSQMDAFELRKRCRLPPLFKLYPMHGRGGNVKGTVAFGRQALMLDVLLRNRSDLMPPSALIT